jgi:hypothetical protein
MEIAAATAMSKSRTVTTLNTLKAIELRTAKCVLTAAVSFVAGCLGREIGSVSRFATSAP